LHGELGQEPGPVRDAAEHGARPRAAAAVRSEALGAERLVSGAVEHRAQVVVVLAEVADRPPQRLPRESPALLAKRDETDAELNRMLGNIGRMFDAIVGVVPLNPPKTDTGD